MISQLLIMLVTAHILTDYALQGPQMVTAKKDLKLFAFLKHISGYFVLAMIFTVNWMSWSLLFAVLIQTLSHGFIDYWKIRLEKKKPQFKFEADLIDVLLHVIIIWITVMLFRPCCSNIILSAQFKNLIPPLFGYKFLVYLSSITFLMKGGTSLVRGIFVKVRKSHAQEDHTGQLIAILTGVLTIYIIEKLNF